MSYLLSSVYNETLQIIFQVDYFKCVREISLFDERPFEHEFFIQIGQAFSYIKKLSLTNEVSQQQKQCRKTEDENSKNYSIIEYSHLTELDLFDVHHDYVEQFLDNTKMCLPNIITLRVEYEPLERATYNFTRNKYSQQFKHYFPHLETL